MDDRVFIFIDGSNLEMAVLDSLEKRVSPIPLAKKLVGERRLMTVNYYEAPLLPGVNKQSYDRQQKFFDRLRMDPYFDVRLGRRVKRDKDYECPECNHKFTKTTYEQKGVDTLIAFDLVALATRNAYDIAILVAGDQDFVRPILEVRMMNKCVEKHNITPIPLESVPPGYFGNMSYPEMLVEIGQKRQGYLKVSDAVDIMLRANVDTDRRLIQANIYSALPRLGKRFIKMVPGEYRYTNSVPRQINIKPSGVRQAVKELKIVNPDMTKQDVYETLVRRGFNFQGKNPKRAVHMAWVNLGYTKEGKQQSLLR